MTLLSQCREVGYESHEELLKVLHELHAAMKTSQLYQLEQRQAETKLRYVEAQRQKLESSIAREKLEKSKKFKLIEKEIAKRRAKYNDAHLKALKARNEYVLCMDAANSAVHKYFIDDLSDIIDVSIRVLFFFLKSTNCEQVLIQIYPVHSVWTLDSTIAWRERCSFTCRPKKI